jgi:tetratricopeptide (TPR) repeat protein
MSTSLRIEELKKKFDENPRRYFAPLANEYRKAGDLQQAIAICQAHLPQQPGHMSGHIVYGQALFEARQFDQARTVFETALALDPENLIALRYLGDIAFELGDRSGARSWYTRVLETDPRNEEIAALMAAMGEDRAPPREAAPAAPVEAPAAAAGASGSPTAAAKGPDTLRAAAESPRDAAPAASSADAELEKLFARPASPPPTSAPPPQPGSFSPLSAFGAAKEGPPSLEQPAPSLSGDALARPTFDAQRGDDTPLQNPPRESAAVPSGARQPPQAAAGGTGFVTETMAQLYLKQGFPDRALGVYRELVAQNPGDRALRERMERIEREMRSGAAGRDMGVGAAGSAPARAGVRDAGPGARGGPTVRQFLATIGSRGLTGRGPGVAPPPGSGPRTSGEFRLSPERPARTAAAGSIDALFAGSAPSREDVAAASTLADAFPAGAAGAAPDASIGGRPAHPAATELSLDHVFRDGGNVGSGRTSAGVSYDQFFSQPAQGSGASSDEATSGGTPASGADDIEQFNAWLQGLKKR